MVESRRRLTVVLLTVFALFLVGRAALAVSGQLGRTGGDLAFMLARVSFGAALVGITAWGVARERGWARWMALGLSAAVIGNGLVLLATTGDLELRSSHEIFEARPLLGEASYRLPASLTFLGAIVTTAALSGARMSARFEALQQREFRLLRAAIILTIAALPQFTVTLGEMGLLKATLGLIDREVYLGAPAALLTLGALILLARDKAVGLLILPVGLVAWVAASSGQLPWLRTYGLHGVFLETSKYAAGTFLTLGAFSMFAWVPAIGASILVLAILLPRLWATQRG